MKRTFCRWLLAALPPLLFSLAAARAGSEEAYDRLLALHLQFEEFAKSVAQAEDHSTAPVEGWRRGLEEFRRRLTDISTADWPVSRKIDSLLVRSRINDLDFTLRVVRPWSRDPGFHLDRFKRVPYVDLPLDENGQAELRRRLREVPPAVERARAELTEPVADLARLAIDHLSRYDGVGQDEPYRDSPPAGTVGWYRDLLERVRAHHPDLVPDAEAAGSAVERYLDWLNQRLAGMNPVSGVGLSEYEWYLKNVRFMPFSADDLRLLADRELHRIQAFLAIEKNRNLGLPELRVPAAKSEFDRSVREAERLIREHIAKRRLLTIPEDAPAQFETDVFWNLRPVHQWHFWEQLQFRDPLNNHIHASIPGHRFDSFIRGKIENPIRRSHQDGARAEGWAFYAEEMFVQSGLLDERPRVKELFYIAALKRAVRIPAELGLQSGEMNLTQAMDYMMERVPFLDRNLAQYDLEVYLRRPTYGMNYTMGRIQLESLLGERMLQLGDRFDLGQFHDAVLGAGIIPFSLIRWEMTGRDDPLRRLGLVD